MLAIKERLEAAGITVWMDVEQMSGSTLEVSSSAADTCVCCRMAFAVILGEGTSVIPSVS